MKSTHCTRRVFQREVSPLAKSDHQNQKAMRTPQKLYIARDCSSSVLMCWRTSGPQTRPACKISANEQTNANEWGFRMQKLILETCMSYRDVTGKMHVHDINPCFVTSTLYKKPLWFNVEPHVHAIPWRLCTKRVSFHQIGLEICPGQPCPEQSVVGPLEAGQVCNIIYFISHGLLWSNGLWNVY